MYHEAFEEMRGRKLMEDLGRRLYVVQDKHGLRTSKMSNLLGISSNEYNKYLRGHARIPVDKLLYLVEEFSLDGNFILRGGKTDEIFWMANGNDKKAGSPSGLADIGGRICGSEVMSDEEKLALCQEIFKMGVGLFDGKTE